MVTPTVPELPSGRIVVEPPPALEQPEGTGTVLTNAVPMLGSLGSLAVVATVSSQSGGGERSLLAAGAFLLGTLAFVVVQVDRQRTRRRHQLGRSRRIYLRHLGDVRARARQAATEQRRALRWHHPPPAVLPALAAEGSRVWERTDQHPQVGRLRFAEAPLPLSVELVPPDLGSVTDPDPLALDALRRLLATHACPSALPLTLGIDDARVVQLCGPVGPARSLARALLCQAVTFHPPNALAVAVLADDDSLAHWEWVKWLPHAHSAAARDAVGPHRLVSGSAARLAELVVERPGHLLLVVDGGVLPPDHLWLRGGDAVTRLEISEHGRGEPRDPGLLRLRLATSSPGPSLTLHRRAREPVVASADQCDLATAEALARRLLPLRTAVVGPRRGGADPLTALLSRPPEVTDARGAWPDRPERDRLRVPVGVDDEGAPVHLDLKEAAHHGFGPHGLVVGATGSGKSELLRSLVLGLAATHSPEHLNFALVDFKGGATFTDMGSLPHVAALVTNLVDDLGLVGRVHEALVGELVRRQEVLRSSGGFASVRDHERAREAGAALPRLPSLLVVVDEFSELLLARPEFLDVFTAIGRLGRSLGIHLLLASQRLEEGRLRGLDAHLSYRVALRTFTTSESRAVLGVADAAELPSVPGTGYLKTGPGRPVRFRACYVSGPACQSVRRTGCAVVLPFTVAEVAQPADPVDAGVSPASGTVLDAVVARLERHGPRARRIWLPPLDVAEPVGGLLGELGRDPELGLVATQWRGMGVTVPLGTVDRPREQRRDPLVVDLGGAGGHLAVVGGPRSGRTTLLQTVAAALALTGTPRETQLFVVDLTGAGLAALAGLPHVVTVATRAEPDVIRAAVAEVRDLLDRREEWFRSRGADVDAYRHRVRSGGDHDGYGEVFVLVDGWASLRSDHEELEPELHRLAERGLALGVHLVITATRWSDLRPRTRDLFGTRLELRLGDPLDSEVDRRTARLVPPDRPGRGLTSDGSHFLGALPALTVADGLQGLVAEVARAWPRAPAPPLRLLPERLALSDVRTRSGAADDGSLLLGLDERWAPVTLDLQADPHLLVLGARGSGRSATLRTIVHEVVRTRAPEQVQVVLVDPRRSLLGEVPPRHLLAHHTTEEQATPALTALADHLHRRLPGPDVTAEQLRNRSWWTGADVFVVVDDHDLMPGAGRPSPLGQLVALLPRAHDVGLHLVVARSTGGAARALHEPVLQGLRDHSSPIVLLPGDPDEGPVSGRLAPRPGPPGRARLARRGEGVRTLQVAWTPPVG